MRHLFGCVGVVLLACSVRAQESAPIDITLKLEMLPTDPLTHVMQWPFRSTSFYLVVKNGEAFLSQTEQPLRDVDKRVGNLEIILRRGQDPGTREFKKWISQISYHHSGPGWSEDRFITDIVVPFSVPRKPGEMATFSDTATMTVTWEVASQGSIRTIADPMGARFEQTLKCITVKSNFNPKTR